QLEKTDSQINRHQNHDHQDHPVSRSAGQKAGVDLTEHLDGHGLHTTVIQHDSGGNFSQRSDPHQDGRAQNGGFHQGQNHFEETLEGADTQVDGGLFDRVGNVVERGRGRANGEGHFTYKVRTGHDDPGAGQHQHAAVV